MTVTDLYTPDTLDVKDRFRDALEDLHPQPEIPAKSLFAVDGLGNRPEEQRPLKPSIW